MRSYYCYSVTRNVQKAQRAEKEKKSEAEAEAQTEPAEPIHFLLPHVPITFTASSFYGCGCGSQAW
jgi:hypothetical protein